MTAAEGTARPAWFRAQWALVAAGAVILLTFRDYGVTWDEPGHQDHGLACVEYYRSGFRATGMDPLYALYGGAFDAPASGLASASPWGAWPTRHLLNALTGLLGLAAAAAIARGLAGEAAAAWAVVLLALTPSWWGHQFNNPKDIPFAAAYGWGVAGLLGWLAAPRLTWARALGFGAIAGAAMGVRVGGVALLGLAGLVAGWRALQGDSGAPRRWLGAMALAWAVMLACWPAAHREPFGWPLEVLVHFTRYFNQRPSVIFGGRILPATDLPPDYVPRYLLLTMPLPFLALLGAAAWQAFRGKPGAARTGPTGSGPIVLAAAALPVAAVMAFQTVIFNGIRHLLFILPPLAALAGAAAARGLAAGTPPVRRVLIAVAVAWGGWHVSVMARLHPVEIVYYNGLAGGLPGALMKYELDYWGNSYPEAIASLRSYLAARAEPPPGRPWRVAACGAPLALAADLPGDWAAARSAADADFMIGLAGVGCAGMDRGRTVATVTRFGVLLSWVLDLRTGPPGPARVVR